MKNLLKSLALIDSISEWVGRLGIGLTAVIMVITTYEAIARYAFNSPTIWSFEVDRYLLVVMIAFGGGYALLHGAHVRVDIIYNRFGTRGKAIIDLATSFLFFSFVIVLLWKSIDAAVWSVNLKEQSVTVLAAPVYIVKSLLAFGFLIILLQGLGNFVRDILVATGKVVGRKSATGLFQE